MTQEDKQLLLADLCSRLPYGVKVTTANPAVDFGVISGISIKGKISVGTKDADIVFECTEVKPYLRPMSSMTEEERKDLLVTIVGNEGVKYFQVLSDGSIDNTDAAHQDLHNFTMHWINFDKDTVTLYLDWLNRHHFDYRGLIPKGLALETPDGMYGKEEQK